MSNDQGQWMLLWSKARNDLRIEPLEKVLSENRQAYKDDQVVDYVPVYIGTRSTVAACAGHCSMTLIEREASRAHLPASEPLKTGEPA